MGWGRGGVSKGKVVFGFGVKFGVWNFGSCKRVVIKKEVFDIVYYFFSMRFFILISCF